VIATGVIGYYVLGPWCLRIVATTIALPLGGMAWYFQNRYRADHSEQERSAKQILQQTHGR